MGNDQSTVRLVIAGLFLLAICTVVGGIVLAMTDRSIPEAIIAIGSAAAGAMGSLLSRTGSNEPADVRVVNQPRDAVPVENADH